MSRKEGDIIAVALDEIAHGQGNGMRIGTPELSIGDGQLTWSVSVEGLPDAPERLWFRLPSQHAEIVTELADPALIGLLLPAMHAAHPIEVIGPVTDDLSHNLTHGYQPILEAMIGGLTRVALDSPNRVSAGDPAPGVGTGFSAGVDSFTVIAEHHFQPLPKDLRLTHLTFFNVGAHDRGERGRDRFRTRFDVLAPVAQAIGLPLVPVDSNLDDFYNFSSYPRTNGPRNMSAASLLQAGISRYYFASSYPYPYIGVRRAYDSGFGDPIALPLLTTRQFRPISHGLQYSRVEKTLIVADIPESHASLNVCVAPLTDGSNCSQCLKCLRTMLTLEIAERLPDYQDVFDLGSWRRSRAAYLDVVVTSRKDLFSAEIRDQARRAEFRLPPYPVALPRRGMRLAIRKARSLGRRIRRRLKL